jgi:hypothetical protein
MAVAQKVDWLSMTGLSSEQATLALYSSAWRDGQSPLPRQ